MSYHQLTLPNAVTKINIELQTPSWISLICITKYDHIIIFYLSCMESMIWENENRDKIIVIVAKSHHKNTY